MRQDAFEQLCRDNPAVARPRRAGRHAEAARPHAVLCLLRRPGPAAGRDDPQRAYRAPRPVPPAADLGQLPRPVPRHQSSATPPSASTPTTAACSPTIRCSTRCTSPTRSAATSATSATTTTGPPTRPARRRRQALIDVDILGHIFEQSITDLERLRNELEGLAEPPAREAQDPPQEGRGFYTPAFITRYIVEQALGGVLRGPLRAASPSSSRRRPRARPSTALADPDVYDLGQARTSRSGRRWSASGRPGRTSWRRSACSTRPAAAGRS